jgi:hypothetical protein
VTKVKELLEGRVDQVAVVEDKVSLLHEEVQRNRDHDAAERATLSIEGDRTRQLIGDVKGDV